MRTDSTILSGQAIKAAEDYIKKEFGDKYHQVRQFKTKNASAQEAHEAIRPTGFTTTHAGDDDQQAKLYELIWRRAIASQMTPAALEMTKVVISGANHEFAAKGEILTFDGFLRVYGGGKDDVILPVIQKGQVLPLQSMLARQTFSRPPARYSEAALVKKLEELGIGRPSTYAPTISTIQTRGYIEKGDLEGTEREITQISLMKGVVTDEVITEVTGADRNKLLPTHLAEVTTDFLVKHFPSVVDYDFTARAEENFDQIADGKQGWAAMLKDFYKDFHPLIEQSADISRQETSQARALGTDPKSGKTLYARYGRYGPMLQIGEVEDEEKPQFAPMPTGATLDNVTMEQALEMFKLPRTVGTTQSGEEIKANLGRFGPYIQIGKLYVSIKPLDPQTITEAEACELYAEKLKKDAEKNITEFASGIKVLNGQYGPYITDGKKNAKIPKDTEPKSLTEAQCKELLAAAPVKGKGRRFTRKKK
jgi:DNA topoisomerase-1